LKATETTVRAEKQSFTLSVRSLTVANVDSIGFVSACGLANEQIGARHEEQLQRLLQRYFRYGLLIVDALCKALHNSSYEK